MRSCRSLLLLSLAAALGACATAGPLGPEGIARLEHSRADNPKSASANRSLGIAYYQAKEYPQARQALQEAAAIDPGDGTTELFLGMTAEAQNDLPAARTAYSSYVKHGRTARVRHLLEDRLAALNQRELAQAAKEQISNEAQLSSIPGSPTTIAVLPMSFSGSDSTLRPLSRGLAELLTTDLARSPKLTVVERERVQALIDEVNLQQSGATDSSTGVRAGKMLQAGRLIAGGIEQSGTDIRVDAPIINVSNAQVIGTPSDDRSLDQLFTIEKNIAFGIFSSLGITLTTAERNAIELRPTKSIAAFLDYSRGLAFQDEGQYERANEMFDQALRIDPGFGAAAQHAQQTQAAVQGSQVSTATVENGLKGTSEGHIVDAASQGVVVTSTVTNTALTTASTLNPSTAGAATSGGGTGTTTGPNKTNPAATGTGADNVTTNTAVITIVIHIPHL
ncbi:MAG TPA: tetratricopeptide repeat protein [Gemmatimonadaceae bacterium]